MPDLPVLVMFQRDAVPLFCVLIWRTLSMGEVVVVVVCGHVNHACVMKQFPSLSSCCCCKLSATVGAILFGNWRRVCQPFVAGSLDSCAVVLLLNLTSSFADQHCTFAVAVDVSSSLSKILKSCNIPGSSTLLIISLLVFHIE